MIFDGRSQLLNNLAGQDAHYGVAGEDGHTLFVRAGSVNYLLPAIPGFWIAAFQCIVRREVCLDYCLDEQTSFNCDKGGKCASTVSCALDWHEPARCPVRRGEA